MEGAIEGHPGKAITMKRRQGGSVGPAEFFGAQITQPIGTKLAAFPIKGPVCYVKISGEVSPTQVAVLSAFVANGRK